ncbi:MAG: tetratricopeptide repeat protein, partial [Candidatus Acidiferrales bacterium]
LYPEAATELESAAKRNPDDQRIMMDLGETYIHSGDKEKGVAAIQKAATNPVLLNNAAFIMADNDLHLDDALKDSQKAVTSVEDDTAGIKLDDLSLKDVQTVPTLSVFWDTLGWVYFRLGQFEPAEKYLRAAFSLSQDPEIADHLGQVYEKQGRKHDAAVAYSRALATEHAPEETRGRLEALGADGRLGPGDKANSETLQNLRISKIPKFPGKPSKHASAEFFLLFAPGPKIVGVKFISGSEELREAGNVLSTSKMEAVFPDDHPTQILRRGILDCEPEMSECDFALIPPGSIRSLQ